MDDGRRRRLRSTARSSLDQAGGPALAVVEISLKIQRHEVYGGARIGEKTDLDAFPKIVVDEVVQVLE